MSYSDRYEDYLNEIPADIEQQKTEGRRHYFSFTSNYDVVLKWDAEVFDSILEEFLEDAPGAEAGDRIGSMRDFARIAAYCAENGLGMNFDITKESVCDFLLQKFSSESSLGGTGAQGAAALSAMGFPVVVQLTDRCEEVCSMLNRSDMRIVRGSKLVPVMEGVIREAPVYHIILQFSKGDIIHAGKRAAEIPLSNRLIFFFDTVQKYVPIDREYLDYLERHTGEVSSLLLSGFDAITDEEVAEERIKSIADTLTRMREQCPDLPVYFEGAFYMNPKVKELFFQKLGPFATVIGTNEEELQDQSSKNGFVIDLTDMSSILEGIERMQERYGCRGIVLHTKDYALFHGTLPKNTDMEKGLTIGNLMSAARAGLGRYGTQQEIRQFLKLPLSQTGLSLYGQLEKLETGMDTVMVPSRYMEHPKYTIGLGDTFVAGVQTCFR